MSNSAYLGGLMWFILINRMWATDLACNLASHKCSLFSSILSDCVAHMLRIACMIEHFDYSFPSKENTLKVHFFYQKGI